MFSKRYKMTLGLENHNCYPCKYLKDDHTVQTLFIGGANRKIVLWLPICNVNNPYLIAKNDGQPEPFYRITNLPKLDEDDVEDIHLHLAYNRCSSFKEE